MKIDRVWWPLWKGGLKKSVNVALAIVSKRVGDWMPFVSSHLACSNENAKRAARTACMFFIVRVIIAKCADNGYLSNVVTAAVAEGGNVQPL